MLSGLPDMRKARHALKSLNRNSSSERPAKMPARTLVQVPVHPQSSPLLCVHRSLTVGSGSEIPCKRHTCPFQEAGIRNSCPFLRAVQGGAAQGYSITPPPPPSNTPLTFAAMTSSKRSLGVQPSLWEAKSLFFDSFWQSKLSQSSMAQ